MSKKEGINPAALEAALRGDIKNALVASTPGGIEKQEAQGQQALINSSNLPTEGDWNELETLGIKRLEESKGLFVKVELPPGWKKAPTDHPMWSNLVDDQGKIRAVIFYKASFYDKRAFIRIEKDHHDDQETD